MAVKAKDFVEKVEQAYTEKWGYIWATAGDSWTEKRQQNLEAKYNSDPARYSDYKQGAQYGSKWIGHTVADCSGLIKWALKQLGITGIYHGSNSQFSKNCSKTGKIVKGEKIPIGALIFTGNEVGQHNHVGVLVKENCVCEAQGTIKGVVHTPLSNKKWTYWGLVKGVTYTAFGKEEQKEDPIPETVTMPITMEVTLPTLRKGDKGCEVALLQQALVKNGETLPKYGVDSDFGNETLKAVKKFQKDHGLVVDGIVGPKTWKALVPNA